MEASAVIGIDFSLTATGIAILYRDGSVHLEVIESEPETKGKQTIAQRRKRARELTDEIQLWVGEEQHAGELGGSAAYLVGIEEPIYQKAQGSVWDRAGAWWTVVNRLGNRCAGVQQAAAKKWATGRGNADKYAVMLAMAKLYPDLEFPHRHAADVSDALSIAHMMAAAAGFPIPLHPWQTAALLESADWPPGYPIDTPMVTPVLAKARR